jgi:hypothetical protein
MRRLAPGCLILSLVGCVKLLPPIEDLSGRENLTMFSLQQVRGMRYRDRLDAEAIFSDGVTTLVVQVRFVIGAPTKLELGRWSWTRGGLVTKGAVAERSVMFLGGQDGPPSIGGRFDLLDSAGTPRYRITIPTTELKTKLQTELDLR